MSLLDDVITFAREWTADCGWNDTGSVDLMDDKQVITLVHNAAEGGFPAFVAAGGDVMPTVWLLMVRRYGIEFANSVTPKEIK